MGWNGCSRSLFLAGVLLLSRPPEAQEPRGVDAGLTEHVGVSLLFLDVEAVDPQGRPMPGLQKDDFRVLLNLRTKPIYSVDDLCPCAGVPPPAEPAGADFVIFLDFSQLQMDGRAEALQEARRWIADSMTSADRAMVASYATPIGLEVLAPFTTDRTRLLEAIEEAEASPARLDTFPMDLGKRVRECRSGLDWCHFAAMKEYRQTRRSMEALLRLLLQLEPRPGRKVLLLFHQNNAVFPARLYAIDGLGKFFPDGRPTDSVPDVVSLLDEVASSATAARTEIHTVLVGPASGWSINFGANLALFTGGTYNRGSADQQAMLDRAGRGCRCIYRIAVEPPELDRSRTYRAVVEIGDYRLPARYRVQFLTAEERWLRRSQAVLLDPASARDVDVSAAILPVAAAEGRWNVKLQVVLDPRSLWTLPVSGRQEGKWEVGALLVEKASSKAWELLGVSELYLGGQGTSSTKLVHEAEIQDLEPGDYELRSFVRDRVANLYGGAAAQVHLPRAKEGGIAGPLLVHPQMRYLPVPLPRLGQDVSPVRVTEVRSGPVPLGKQPAAAGERLAGISWACPGAQSKRVRRGVRSGATPVATFGESPLDPTDGCREIEDEIDTGSMAAGSYRYDVGFDDYPEGQAATASFEIAAPLSVAASAPEVPVVPVVPQAAEPTEEEPEDVELAELLEKLAMRAELHDALIYEFTCIEDLTRQVYVYGRLRENRTMHERHGLVVTRDETGKPRARRQKLDREDGVVLRSDGRPVTVSLPRLFRPIAQAVPQAAVSWFTPSRWDDLSFSPLEGRGIRCPEERFRAVEFLDRRGPRRDGIHSCTATASGRMCVDPADGEVSRIQFYSLYEEDGACHWDLEAPFMSIDQGVIDAKTGLRFPERVVTHYPSEKLNFPHPVTGSFRDNAVITQRFENCVFPEVRVSHDIAGASED